MITIYRMQPSALKASDNFSHEVSKANFFQVLILNYDLQSSSTRVRVINSAKPYSKETSSRVSTIGSKLPSCVSTELAL